MRSLDRQIAQALGQDARRRRVIEVAVGEQNALDADAGLGHHGEDAVHITARVDHRGAAGLLANQEAAVLLKGSDRDDSVFHGRDRERKDNGALASAARQCTGKISGAGRRESPATTRCLPPAGAIQRVRRAPARASGD